MCLSEKMTMLNGTFSLTADQTSSRGWMALFGSLTLNRTIDPKNMFIRDIRNRRERPDMSVPEETKWLAGHHFSWIMLPLMSGVYEYIRKI